MNKKFNKKLISEAIVYMYEKRVIVEPQFTYWIKDRNLPDEFFKACESKGLIKNEKEDIIKLGRYSIYAGAVTHFSQSQKQAPVEMQSEEQIADTVAMYNAVDMIEYGDKFLEQIGWGPFNNAVRKRMITTEIAKVITNTYIRNHTVGVFKKKIDMSEIDNFVYIAFCLGITMGQYGNIVMATDFSMF